MDEFTADAFANREEPIPYVAVPQNEGEPSSPDSERRRDKMKRYLSATNMKNKAQGIVASQLDENRIKPGNSMSLQDRVFSKILQQVIPADEDDDYETTPTSPAEKRSSAYVSRPAFSLPLMTNNFRRFNARIGIVFVFQNQLIRLFTWRVPTHTLSFLATYTFVCLDPYLLVVLPLAVALLSIMVPAFTSRHPPPPRHSALSSTTPYDHQAYTGPAIAPARTIKPVSETSKDFFRNMRDLQNSMADFSNGHDLMVTTVAPATNFSNETFSSQLFLYLTILTTLSFITAHLLPWRLISLLTGWSLVVSNHPTAQSWLAKMQKRAEKQAQLTLNDPTLKHQAYIQGIPLPATPARMQSALTSLSEITLSSTPETREVEIFELQHRPLQSMTSKSSAAAEWQPHVFTSSPYDPLSPSRIAGDRPHGTRFFEDVAPPEGWEWASKKWELDLEAGEWVNDRLVVGVEYDILQHDDDPNIATNRRDSINADFGGWVWDLPPVPGSGANREDDLWLAYGEYDVPSTSHMKEDGERRKKNAEKRIKDWEEGTIVDNKGRTGEWRRRRWVRLVKRKPVDTTT